LITSAVVVESDWLGERSDNACRCVRDVFARIDRIIVIMLYWRSR
jgi:hypothetical protein